MLLLLLALISASTARVPVCNQLRFTGIFVSGDTGEPYYKYGFDFGVSFNPNNLTFPNKVRITNYETWSADPSEIYQVAPVLFAGTVKQCSTLNETCILDFPNGVTQLLYPMMINGSSGNIRSNQRPFINNGNIFDGYYGDIMDPVYHIGMGWGNQGAVCTNFYYINVPEDNYGSCVDFKSITKLTDPDKNTTVTLNADYVTFPWGFNVTKINFTSFPDGFTYEGPNIHYYRGVKGDTADPVKYFLLGLSGLNYQVEWTLDLTSPTRNLYPKLIAGELIRRNGIFYKDDSVPYTVSDPCFNLTYIVPYSNATTPIKLNDYCEYAYTKYLKVL